jgi:hypothetical protein
MGIHTLIIFTGTLTLLIFFHISSTTQLTGYLYTFGYPE